MKQGSHIMLQRLVRSTVSTEPRPCVMVLEPCLCSLESLCARMSRPGKTSSRCLKNAVSMAITSSKWPWMGQSFTIRILPSRSMTCALISPGLVGVEHFERRLAVQNLLADFRHAARAQRIGLARPAQRRLGLFPGLQQRLVRPLRNETRVLADLIELVEDKPSRAGGVCQGFFGVFDRLVHGVPSPAVRNPCLSMSIGKDSRPPHHGLASKC